MLTLSSLNVYIIFLYRQDSFNHVISVRKLDFMWFYKDDNGANDDHKQHPGGDHIKEDCPPSDNKDDDDDDDVN